MTRVTEAVSAASGRVRAVASRAPDVVAIARRDGLSGLSHRVIRRAYKASRAGDLEFALHAGDIADSTRLDLATPSTPVPAGRPLRVGWVMTPPSPGSGGHTTIFRMVKALEDVGHTCELILYDRFGGDPARQAEVIRRTWPWIRASVRGEQQPGADLDVCLATSWQTAHVLARRPWTTRRMYFVQDYEPYFFPRGAEYALAEDTYRFGFPIVAIGHMVADVVGNEVGVPATVAPFGTDSSVYRLENRGARNGVVFYTKPDVPRRGFQLGVLALEDFHRRRPDQEIHLFGDDVPDLPFPATRHGRLTPVELNRLYNRTRAGFAMSFTNISLVAEEMLASGTIPVVGDSWLARADLGNPFVSWGAPTPGGLADALIDAVSGDDAAVDAAASVRGDDWAPAQKVLVEAVEQTAYASS